MKILVLGGTGFLGPHEIGQMVARGWEVTMFNRGRSETPLFAEAFERVERLEGDRDPRRDAGLGAIERAIRDGARWDAVIDNSGYVPRIARASAELLRDAARQYIFVSTISVYAGNDRPDADEAAPLGTMEDPTNEDVNAFYGPLKALCEQEIVEVFGEQATLIRPGLIVGPGDKTDRFTWWPVRCHHGGEVLVPDVDAACQFIDVRDLAAFIVTCAEQGHGGAYNATGPLGPLSFREMVDGCKAVTSSSVEFVPVPESFLLENGVRPWMGPDSMAMWIPQDPSMTGFSRRSNRRAVEHGCRFRPLAETARATLDWWLGSKRAGTEVVPGRAGLSLEREAELLASWRASSDGD